MPLQAFRAKQSTNTSGTGTLALLAAPANARSFLTAFGSTAVKCRYVISSGSIYELGIGTFDGGSPGTITRDTVLASSASGALVSLPAGTADVFAWIEPHDRRIIETAAASYTLTLADLGSLLIPSYSGAATVNLPSLATVPPGAGFEIGNAGGAPLTVACAGADTFTALGLLSQTGTTGLASLSLAVGDRMEVRRNSGGWLVVNLTAARIQAGGQAVTGGGGLQAAAVAGATIDLNAGNYFYKTATGALSWGISGAPASRTAGFVLELTNGGTGTQSWPGSVKWPSGAPPALTASGVDVLVFLTRDGGATWRGVLTMRDSR